jgi:CDP-6-deoxy-D-xylo-4-hexulose-3-dehydrase
MQAAVGVGQLERLDDFIAARRANFAKLAALFKQYEEFFILPEATPRSEPSWFGFPLTLRDGTPFAREELTKHFDANRIGTRLLLGGNILKQPYFRGRNYRVVGDLTNADLVTSNTFWLGVFPGLTDDHFAFIDDVLKDFLAAR